MATQCAAACLARIAPSYLSTYARLLVLEHLRCGRLFSTDRLRQEKCNSLRYRNYQKEQLSLGDLLALDRTRLANERTFLAYLRAGLMLLVSAVSILKLLPNEEVLVTLAWFMLPISLLLAGVGAFRSIRLARLLKQLESSSQ